MNKKITDLPADTNPTSDDLLVTVNDPEGGSPETRSITIDQLMGLAPVQSSDISGFASTVSLGNHVDLAQAHGISAFGASLVDDADAATARTTLGLGTAATTASTDYATSGHTHGVDDLTDVDTSTSQPSDGQYLQWSSTNWVPASVDVNTPINEALRGTANPHIGAYPNQPFNVLDNPAKSVMIVTNSAGELDFLIPDGGNLFINSPSGGRVSPSFGFSVSEDANEPDIEVASGGDNYSVISGDSDKLAINGLPYRQGFNNPDIGAYASPTLISGGSIA